MFLQAYILLNSKYTNCTITLMQKKISKKLPQVKKLSCGAQAIIDRVDSVDSLTCGIWVATGSRQDPDDRAGLAHFYEHMLFKGTNARNAYQIAADIEACGGMINAYTSREQTAFYARMPSEHLERGLDILCDIVCNAKFPQEELVMEQNVVTQEIAQSFDQPDDHVFDAFQAQVYPRQLIGRPILGYSSSIADTCRDDLEKHRAKHYYGENMVVSFSGNGDFDKGLDFVERTLANLPKKQTSHSNNSVENTTYDNNKDQTPRFACSLSVEERDIEQCHSIIGFPAFSRHHDDYYAAQILCAVLGQGMASTLFQEIREKRGLAYSISSFYQAWQDAGMLAIYTASDRTKMQELQEALKQCLQSSVDELQNQDIERAKAQLSSSLVMGLESPPRRAAHWASQLLAYGKIIDPHETREKINSTEKKKLLEIAAQIFKGSSAITVLGPLAKETLSEITAFGQAH